MKVFINYVHDEDEDKSMTVKIKLPKKWLKGPTDKIKETFVESYNKKHGDGSLDMAHVHLEYKNKSLPSDEVIEKCIDDRAQLYVVAGESTTVAVVSAAAAADKAAAAKAKVGLLRCKNFGCNATYRQEENHEQACRFHASPPIFHETAKWWSCCPHKKAWDWESFQAIPGCQRGFHSDTKAEKQFLGGSDLREEAEKPKLKSIDDFNKKAQSGSGVLDSASNVAHRDPMEELRGGLVAVGVDGKLFDKTVLAVTKQAGGDAGAVTQHLKTVFSDALESAWGKAAAGGSI